MTDKKISQLPPAVPLTGAELVPIVQAGATVQTTVSQILADATADAFAVSGLFSEIAGDEPAQATARANLGLAVIDGGTFF